MQYISNFMWTLAKWIILISDLVKNLLAIYKLHLAETQAFSWTSMYSESVHNWWYAHMLLFFWFQILCRFNLLNSKSHLNFVTPSGTGLGGSKETVTGICALFSWTEKKDADQEQDQLQQKLLSDPRTWFFSN